MSESRPFSVAFTAGTRSACVKGDQVLLLDLPLSDGRVMRAWEAIDAGESADDVVGVLLSEGMSRAPGGAQVPDQVRPPTDAEATRILTLWQQHGGPTLEWADGQPATVVRAWRALPGPPLTGRVPPKPLRQPTGPAGRPGDRLAQDALGQFGEQMFLEDLYAAFLPGCADLAGERGDSILDKPPQPLAGQPLLHRLLVSRAVMLLDQRHQLSEFGGCVGSGERPCLLYTSDAADE